MRNIVIIGFGAMGSVLASIVARMSGVSGITMIDHDTYSAGNLMRQAIGVDDVGLPKPVAQAARIRPLNPGLRVRCVQERIENVPLGLLRDSIIVSCVDNRRARQTISRLAWRSGSPLLDGAINAPSQLRVTAYRPGAEEPCLECAWDQRSYELLEQEYPCAGGERKVPATGAPVELSALAASYLALELGRLLRQQAGEGGSGSQLLLDTSSHEQHLTGFRYNPGCRFDHKAWCVDALDLDVTESKLAGLFDHLHAGPDTAISMEGHVFVTRLDCVDCGGHRDVGLRLYGRIPPGGHTCGGRLLATGFSSRDSIRRRDLSPEQLALRLAEVGLRSGDVITVSNDANDSRHLELKGGHLNA